MRQFITIFFLVFILACSDKDKSLPILGERKVKRINIDGKIRTDTIYYTIGNFSFLNQFNDTIKGSDLKNKVFISSCFFSTCPTVCHRLMEESLDSINSALGNNKNFYTLSHTIDPNHDTPTVLKAYSKKFDIKGKNWYFLTGMKEDSLYDFLTGTYFLTATKEEQNSSSGGYIHSAAIVLVDKNNRIRGLYDGMNKEKINTLISDAKYLLNDNSY